MTHAIPTPRISVCLLSYNHSAVLREVIASILAQDFTDFELIVSDDCSRDGSWELLQEIAASDARLRCVRPQHNLGMAENANFAVRQARAEYVALLHHDDLCRRDLLRKWFELIHANPGVAFVSNAYAIAGTARVDYHPFSSVTPGAVALQILLRRLDCPIRGTAMIRRQAWEMLGGMRARFGLLADIDLWMRLAARWDLGYVAEPLLTVQELRPADYPRDYVTWSWTRRRILYEIHGTNREEYFGADTLRGRVELARFRARVAADELLWLSYALVKRKPIMLTSSDQVANPYEVAPLRWVREGLRHAALAARRARAERGP